MSVNGTQIAKMMDKSSYESVKAIQKQNAYSKGEKDGMYASLNQVKNDRFNYNQRFQAGKNTISPNAVVDSQNMKSNSVNGNVTSVKGAETLKDAFMF